MQAPLPVPIPLGEPLLLVDHHLHIDNIVNNHKKKTCKSIQKFLALSNYAINYTKPVCKTAIIGNIELFLSPPISISRPKIMFKNENEETLGIER